MITWITYQMHGWAVALSPAQRLRGGERESEPKTNKWALDNGRAADGTALHQTNETNFFRRDQRPKSAERKYGTPHAQASTSGGHGQSGASEFVRFICIHTVIRTM